MSRNESILVGAVALMLVLALSFWEYQGNLCKIEAIKAGMKGEEVLKACR